MSEKIKPALTPEEWASLSVHPGACDTVHIEGDHLSVYSSSPIASFDDDPTASINDTYSADDTLTPEYKFFGEDRHSLAALALYNQPFGFTRETLLILAKGIPPYDGYYETEWTAEELDKANAELDKIKALLPPEPSE